MKNKLKLLPNNPGCYLMKNDQGNIIYVGKAKNLKRRVNSYFNKIQTGKTKALVDNIFDFDYIVTNSEKESLILEINLIKKYTPKYNILLKDDKTYPYIVLTNEKYPSLKIVRSKVRKNSKDTYFGPYPNVTSAKKVVELISRMYPLKKCNNIKKDLCLYYHINECLGYCKFDVSKEVIDEMVGDITKVLNGDLNLITHKLNSEMIKASDNLDFERAIILKDYINDIRNTVNKQIIVSNIKYNFDVFGIYKKDDFLSIEALFIRNGVVLGKVNKIFNNIIDEEELISRYIISFYEKYDMPKAIVFDDIYDLDYIKDILSINIIYPKKGDIKKILNLSNLNAKMNLEEQINLIKSNEALEQDTLEELKRILNIDKLDIIEAFDNSHLFGTYYVGAMVVFEGFKPKRNNYRKYKIETNIKDDLGAMEEVIYRRYYRVLIEKSTLPSLIIVDGGKNQVNVCKQVLNSLNLNIKVIGLLKDSKHKLDRIITDDNKEILIKQNRNLYIFMGKISEEVHRFVISYHRDIKTKGSIASNLENVKGLGEARRIKLLKKYNSIDKIRNADIDELAKIIPLNIAKSLKEYLSNIDL